MKEITWETVHPFDKKPLTNRFDKDPCINLELIRLGSAPPYRRVTKLQPNDILPTLSKQSHRLVHLYEPATKQSFKLSCKGKVGVSPPLSNNTTLNEHISNENVILHNFHDILRNCEELKSTDADGSVANNKMSRHATMHEHTKANSGDVSSAVFLNNNKPINKNKKPEISVYSNKMCSASYDKLKISGKSMTCCNGNTKKYQEMQKLENNNPNFINDLRMTNKALLTQKQKSGFYYRKRDTFVNQSVPSNLKFVSQSIRRVDLFHRGFNHSKAEVVESNNRHLPQETTSLREYCRIENQRYLIDCKSIKTILFQRWIANIEQFVGRFHPFDFDIVDEEEDKSATDDSDEK